MIPDLAYTNRSLYIFNQARSNLIYLLGLRAIDLYIKGLCYLVNILTFTKFIIRTMALTKLIFA